MVCYCNPSRTQCLWHLLHDHITGSWKRWKLVLCCYGDCQLDLTQLIWEYLYVQSEAILMSLGKSIVNECNDCRQRNWIWLFPILSKFCLSPEANIIFVLRKQQHGTHHRWKNNFGESCHIIYEFHIRVRIEYRLYFFAVSCWLHITSVTTSVSYF